MATTTTYAVALTTIKDFAINAGFDNDEVIAKIDNLIKQKSKRNAKDGKSAARVKNEDTATNVVDVARAQNVERIDNKWVRENIEGVNSPARATAVLNAAVDLGLIERHIVAKSATRNELYYTIN